MKQSSSITHLGKSLGRLAAVQTLYQYHILGEGYHDFAQKLIGDEFQSILGGEPVAEVDCDFFTGLVTIAVEHMQASDALIIQHLAKGWSLNRLDKVSLSMLQAGAAELGYYHETPAVIIISEYTSLAHAFFAETEASFVNGLLNNLARFLRPEEFSSPTKKKN